MVRLRSFDAFPKVDESYYTSGQPKNPMVYMFMIISVFFLYLETSTMMGAEPKFRFDVDKEVGERFQINLQILVKSPCESIGIFIKDESSDQLLVNELVQSVRHHPIEDSDEEWCELGGMFETNRVMGDLVIGSRKPQADFNTSHYIQELSFGEYYPSMINPLDHKSKDLDEPSTVEYYLSILPATYEAFGASIDTHLYTYREVTKPSKTTNVMPMIRFHYDFDAIKVTISDSRMSFFAWLCRVINIVGGVIFAVKALSRMVKSKSRHVSEGILDRPITKTRKE